MGKYESFRDLSGGIQSLVTAAALVCGGLWTFHTFGALSMRVRAENERTEQELRLERRANISVALSVDVNADPEGKAAALALVTVTLTNSGSRHAHLDTTTQAIVSVMHVTLSDDAPPEFSDRQDSGLVTALYPKVPLKSLVLAAGASASFPVAFSLSRPGLYYASFHIPAGAKEIEEAEKVGHPSGKGGVFDGSRYFVVAQTNQPHVDSARKSET